MIALYIVLSLIIISFLIWLGYVLFLVCGLIKFLIKAIHSLITHEPME